jgi:hypothetical protein
MIPPIDELIEKLTKRAKRQIGNIWANSTTYNDNHAATDLAAAAVITSLQERISKLEEALDQLLDDMGVDGLCVCQQAKDEAIEARAPLSGGGEG